MACFPSSGQMEREDLPMQNGSWTHAVKDLFSPIDERPGPKSQVQVGPPLIWT